MFPREQIETFCKSSASQIDFSEKRHQGPYSQNILKENATVFPYSNMFFPQLRRVDMYLSRLSPCT